MDKKKLNELLEKISLGDEYAFEEFFILTNKSIFSFVYLIVKQKEDAEDIVQETYIKIKKNISSYKLGTNPSAWFFQIAKNLALDKLKSKKHETTLDYDFDSPVPDSSSNIDSRLVLHDIMNKFLEQDERQIISLHLESGFKHREIAKILNIPLGTVLWKYNRSMKILKEKLKEGV